MRTLMVAGLLALGGCTSPASKPAMVGMSVDSYRLSCSLGDIVISESEGWVVGECPDKPQEYVEFRAGQVTSIMTPAQMFERLADHRCQAAQDRSACRAAVIQAAAEHESRKASAGRAARQAELDQILSGVSVGPGPAMPAGAGMIAPAAPGMMCFYKSSMVSGQNRICNYDCLGSLTAVTQSMMAQCPMTINR